MKYLFIVVTAICVLASCNNTAIDNSNIADSVQIADSTNSMHTDSIPDGNSSSSSEFNKGNSSPAGSTGVIDSAAVKSSDSMSLKKVKNKKTAKDSVKR